MNTPQWDIRRQGRAWTREEIVERYQFMPEKIELIEGKLFWREEDRLTCLALLLENVGIDAILQIGSLDVWKSALRDAEKSKRQ